MFGIHEGLSFIDSLEIYEVNKDGKFTNKILETNFKPTLLQKIKCKLGLYKYANDIVMNEGLVDIASYIEGRFGYMSVGTSSNTPSDTTLHTLIAPSLSRSALTKGIDTTYITNDTVVFSATFTASETTDFYEAGIFKDSTTSVSDVMLCRQTFTQYTVAAGSSFGIIWKIICTRG